MHIFLCVYIYMYMYNELFYDVALPSGRKDGSPAWCGIVIGRSNGRKLMHISMCIYIHTCIYNELFYDVTLPSGRKDGSPA